MTMPMASTTSPAPCRPTWLVFSGRTSATVDGRYGPLSVFECEPLFEAVDGLIVGNNPDGSPTDPLPLGLASVGSVSGVVVVVVVVPVPTPVPRPEPSPFEPE